jgi:transcriptional regulator with XRE-family HTH domain
MATDGTPEPAAKRCGEAIARLRTARRWSRAHLVIRLYDELSPDDPSYDSISETWLARLENGRMVKVPRQTVEALCRALHCTPRERAHVLLHADRCALTDSDTPPTPPSELLAYVMERLYSEAYEVLNGLLREAAAPDGLDDLDDVELFEMAASALDTLITRRTRQQAQAAANGSNGHTPQQRPPLTAREGRITLVPRLTANSVSR